MYIISSFTELSGQRKSKAVFAGFSGKNILGCKRQGVHLRDSSKIQTVIGARRVGKTIRIIPLWKWLLDR